MSERNFTELAGRIEGVAKAIMCLTAALEEAKIIDGPRFADGLRRAVRPAVESPPLLEVARTTLHEMAAALDGARSSRQSRRE